MKYEDYAKLGFQLGRKMVDLLEPNVFANVDGLIPIPLHTVKYRERGYNQAEWISRGIAKNTGIPVLKRSLKRIRYTQSQTTLSAQERKNNLDHAFLVTAPVNGRALIVVDDVLTTGATISSAAWSLKKSGAVTVTAVTVSTPE
ncbi:MAG: ComF family protein [FCB group bacterium]|nr:ComF family protein [FCB group bacterium]